MIYLTTPVPLSHATVSASGQTIITSPNNAHIANYIFCSCVEILCLKDFVTMTLILTSSDV